MSGGCGQIYSRYRRAAGLTQERAAELLGTATRTLSSWETGEHCPPDEMVVLMADVYQSPTLPLEHLRAVSRVGQELIPVAHSKSLAEAALTLLTAMQDFDVSESDLALMRICADGKVSPGEARQFSLIIGQLNEIVAAAYEVRLAVKGGGRDAED